MPTIKQEEQFAEEIQSQLRVERSTLDTAIDWITSNMSIEEVFGEDALLKEAKNYDPEGIFDKGTLSGWAEDNGYIKEDTNA